MMDSAIPNNYDDAESQELIRQHDEQGRHFGALTVSRAASRQGAQLEWYSDRMVWVKMDDRRIPVLGFYGPESSLSSAIVSKKDLAKDLMEATGTPVPVGRQVLSAEDAIAAQHEIGGPVVLKPVAGSMGHGVTVNISDPDDVRIAYHRAAEGGTGVLLEQYVDGKSEYRAHATNTECVAVFRRILPSVTGDGKSTIEQLVVAKNEHRKHNPTTAANPIPMDDVALGLLRRRGLSWTSVPAAGETIIVRDVNGITSGGDSEECLDTASEELKQAAVNAVRAIPGMSWAGVDILVDDRTGTPYVLEVNTNAATNGSTFPVFGKSRDVGSRLWDEIYLRSRPETFSAPTPAIPLQTPETLESVFSGLPEPRVTLQQLTMLKTESLGRTTEKLTRDIWTASESDKPTWWFNATLTGADQRTAIHPIRRPLAYRQILRMAKLPIPLGKRVRTSEGLQDFQNAARGSVALIPIRKGLGRGASTIVRPGSQSDVLDGKSAWIAQARRRGHRFCVIASPEAALLVLSSNSHQDVPAKVLERVSTLAVRAVRAMPQLRWAAVDILHRFERDVAANRPEALIEDVSLNPRLRTDSWVLAGSFDTVLNLIIQGAEETAERFSAE